MSIGDYPQNIIDLMRALGVSETSAQEKPDLVSGEVHTRIIVPEATLSGTGDPFWDGFNMTVEVSHLPHGKEEMIYYVHTATNAQADRFLAMLEQGHEEPA